MELVEWASGEMIVLLEGGRRVIAHDGDEFLVEETGDGGIRFLEHHPRTIN